MRVLLLTVGSRGDVQPYVALGKGLKAAGHDVMVATCARFQGFVEEHGLQYGFISDDILKIVDSDQGRALVEDTRGILRIIAANVRLARRIAPIQHRMMDESWDVAARLRPDIVCFHPKAFIAPAIAEKLGIPAVLASPIPMLVPTGEAPCIGFPELPFGRAYNRWTYAVVHFLMQVFAGRFVRAWRARNRLPARRGLDLLRDQTGRPIPALHGFSACVSPAPDDWPPTAAAAGYWFLDTDADWTPPADLRAFLDIGPPPVYVGFGSMAGRDPKRLTRLVVDALRTTGQRGIIATGWGGLDPDSLPDTILKIDQAPHDWLFPRVAAVVHHGGAGTTAAGLKAGKPTLVCPFFADQPFWGKTAYRLGAGPRPIPQKLLSAENLAAAVVELTDNVAMRRSAEAVAACMRREDGIGNAIAFIERVA